MFSTTTMASSTTMPMASTRPNSDRLFSEKPKAAITAKVPTSETGMARIGIIAARQLCRKTITTSTTSTMASNRVFSTSVIEARDVFGGVVDDLVAEPRREVWLRAAPSSALIASAVCKRVGAGQLQDAQRHRRLAHPVRHGAR